MREAGSSGLAELAVLEDKVRQYGRSGVDGLTEAWHSGAMSLSNLSHHGMQVSAGP
jgi:hypothetical protein